ncbi:MAG: hypothetical protein ABFD50_16605 [Smithella sp.]
MTNKSEGVNIVDFAGSLITKESKVYANVKQEFIVTTDDKIRICLNDHIVKLDNNNAWKVPVGICVTIALTLFTTDFKQSWGFSADFWYAFFCICLILSSGWLFKSWRDRSEAVSITDILNSIKKGSFAFQETVPVGVPDKKDETMSTSQNLKIIHALYGANGKFINVTNRINSFVIKDTINVTINNETMGDDPIKGVGKYAHVYYSFRNEENNIQVEEKKILKLP